MFAPFKTKQYEIGAKADWGRFTTTVSAFQIKRPSGFTENGRYSVNGEQRNRGIELNIFGEVAPGVRLLGGGTYLRAELTKTQDGIYDGNDAIGVPRKQVNLGGEWDTPFVPALTLTARVLYTDKQYVDQANNLSTPDWTRVDFGARYKLDVYGKPVVLRANLENAFNKDYWNTPPSGYLYVESPRTLQLSATVDF
jgi:iron complex outermembrane receptor protein